MFTKTVFPVAITLAFAISGVAISQSTAAEITTDVMVRNKKGQLRVEAKTLDNLKSIDQTTYFENSFFKIVIGTSENAIPVSTEEPIRLKAATAYFHANIARNYFQSILKNTKDLEAQHTIRIEMDQDYSTATHFMPGKTLDQVRNIAFTVAASNPDYNISGTQWNSEIWFQKAEKIHAESRTHQVAAALNQRDYKMMIAGTLLMSDLSAITGSAQNGTIDWPYHLVSMAFSLGLAEIVPTILDWSTRLIKRTIYLDSVLIPEIIYHEMGHVALRSWIDNKGSTPITEGLPNFFAGKIAGLDKIAARGGRHIRGIAPKRGLSKGIYSLDEEATVAAAHGSFTYSLLNELDRTLGTEGIPIIVRSLNYLDRSSDLRNDLTYAVLKAIRDVSQDPDPQTILAREVFRRRGL